MRNFSIHQTINQKIKFNTKTANGIFTSQNCNAKNNWQLESRRPTIPPPMLLVRKETGRSEELVDGLEYACLLMAGNASLQECCGKAVLFWADGSAGQSAEAEAGWI